MAYAATIDSFQNNFNIAKAVKNNLNYISTMVFPGKDPDLYLAIDNEMNVIDNIDSMNTRGHFLHQEYKAHKLFSGKEAQEFRQYLKSTGRPTAKTEGYLIFNITGYTMAGVAHDTFTQNVAPSISMDYHKMIAKEARESGFNFKSVELHTILHEIAHTSKTPKNIINNLIYDISPIAAEKYAEITVYEYSLKKSKETDDPEQKQIWLEVAEIAEGRYKNVKKIYSRKRRKGIIEDTKEKNIEEKVKDEEVKEESKNSKKSESKYSKEKDYEGKVEENSEENNSEEVNPEDRNLDDVVGEGDGEGAGACEGGEEVSE